MFQLQHLLHPCMHQASSFLQGNVGATPQAGPHVVAEGPFCMMKQHEGGPEAAAISGLSRRSSLTKRQLDVFIPANITPDVERRLHVSCACVPSHGTIVCWILGFVATGQGNRRWPCRQGQHADVICLLSVPQPLDSRLAFGRHIYSDQSPWPVLGNIVICICVVMRHMQHTVHLHLVWLNCHILLLVRVVRVKWSKMQLIYSILHVLRTQAGQQAHIHASI